VIWKYLIGNILFGNGFLSIKYSDEISLLYIAGTQPCKYDVRGNQQSLERLKSLKAIQLVANFT
jgi:hypothetical protein